MCIEGRNSDSRLYTIFPIGSVRPAGQIWDRVDLATGGYTIGQSSRLVFGVDRVITDVVWHDTEGDSVEGAVATWNQGNAAAHLTIGNGKNGDVDGEIVLTVAIEDVAWHAGTNSATGRTPFWQINNINPRSIGVEIVGHYLIGYTPAQMDACRRIAQWTEQTYQIPRIRIQDGFGGHHAHSEISNQRSDPGPLFDWGILD